MVDLTLKVILHIKKYILNYSYLDSFYDVLSFETIKILNPSNGSQVLHENTRKTANIRLSEKRYVFKNN